MARTELSTSPLQQNVDPNRGFEATPTMGRPALLPARSGLVETQEPAADGARSREVLEAALSPALAAITAEDGQGWVRLRGYASAS
jgi:hypothetical protein